MPHTEQARYWGGFISVHIRHRQFCDGEGGTYWSILTVTFPDFDEDEIGWMIVVAVARYVWMLQ